VERQHNSSRAEHETEPRGVCGEADGRLTSPGCGVEAREASQQRKLQNRAPVRSWGQGLHYFLAWLVGVRLGLLYQHPPRALRIPKGYDRVRLPSNPPTIALVTPTFNHGRFLERTLRSVLDQRYPRLEYVVQDGGSQDDSAEILRRLQPGLKHWESGPDEGQTSAINRGFRKTAGEIMAYLNSDDVLLPGALAYAATFFHDHPDVDAIYSHRVLIDEHDGEIGRWVLPRHCDEVLSWVDFVPQETLFWRRRLWDKVGGRLDESFQFAMDWDLLLRFRDAGARFVRVPRYLAAFRVHESQKTQRINAIGRQESRRLRERLHGRDISEAELLRQIRPYVMRHAVYQQFCRMGLLRY